MVHSATRSETTHTDLIGHEKQQNKDNNPLVNDYNTALKKEVNNKKKPVLASRKSSPASDIKYITNSSKKHQCDHDNLLFNEIESSDPNIELIKKLLLNDANPNAKNANGDTLLHVAASLNGVHIKIIELLIEHGANVNEINDLGQIPLHRAQNCKSAQVLLKNNSNPNAKDANGNTLLHEEASMPKHDDMVNLLISYKANIHAKNNNDQTPLHTSGDVNSAKILIENGADIHAKDSDGNTPLHEAASILKNDDIVNLLISYKANIHAKNNDGQTPLHTSRDVDSIKILLENGADIHAKDSEGNTPLHEVVSSYWVYHDAIEFLIKMGASVHETNDLGQTPLHKAGSVQSANILCNHGADINAKDATGNTPLHEIATLFSSGELITFLLKKGANSNEKNNLGHTPLQQALLFSFEPSFDMANSFTDYEADVNVKDKSGMTPLHAVLKLEDPADNLIDLMIMLAIKQSTDLSVNNHLIDETFNQSYVQQMLANFLAYISKDCPQSIQLPTTHKERVDCFNQKITTLINENSMVLPVKFE